MEAKGGLRGSVWVLGLVLGELILKLCQYLRSEASPPHWLQALKLKRKKP